MKRTLASNSSTDSEPHEWGDVRRDGCRKLPAYQAQGGRPLPLLHRASADGAQARNASAFGSVAFLQQNPPAQLDIIKFTGIDCIRP
eukprot:3210545-Rhodomonas_salina.2